MICQPCKNIADTVGDFVRLMAHEELTADEIRAVAETATARHWAECQGPGCTCQHRVERLLYGK